MFNILCPNTQKELWQIVCLTFYRFIAVAELKFSLGCPGILNRTVIMGNAWLLISLGDPCGCHLAKFLSIQMCVVDPNEIILTVISLFGPGPW